MTQETKLLERHYKRKDARTFHHIYCIILKA